jgi:acyl-CoA hydrolase
MNLAERIKNAETHQFRMVCPCYLNDNGYLFGGNVLKWMDEVAYLTAQRFTRMQMVTVSAGNVHFRKAISPGTMLEIIGKVSKVGNVKVDIDLEVYTESIENSLRELAVDGTFTFAAINKFCKPVCLKLAEDPEVSQ